MVHKNNCDTDFDSWGKNRHLAHLAHEKEPREKKHGGAFSVGFEKSGAAKKGWKIYGASMKLGERISLSYLCEVNRCQDFSKILVVLGFEIQGGRRRRRRRRSWYPYKTNGKINRVKTTTCQCYRHNYVPMLPSVQVGVRQNFVQGRVYFWAARVRHPRPNS